MTQKIPHVVIIGAGFGGMEVAKGLAKSPVRITLIDRHNYHLFQPLLYQVAIAGLVPSQIAYPLRSIFRKQNNINIQMGEVTEINLDARFIKMNGSVTGYDYLILAVGGETNFFGLKSVEQYGFQLKNIESAVATRNHLLESFEKASREADTDKRRALLTFVVAGAGPTGVETAGALAELITHVMAKDYPQMDLREARVLLLEAGGSVMPGYPERLRKAAFNLLREKRVEIVLNARLIDYNGQQATLGDGTCIQAHTLIWTAGVRAARMLDALDIQRAGLGRVRVDPCLRIAIHPEVFVLGDAAYLEDGTGNPLPMLATVAQQQASVTAQNIRRIVAGDGPRPFRYKDPGLLATIGRNAAVARIFGLSLSGFVAWVIWVSLHIYRLIGFRNRLIVLINWAWDYVFYETQVRLITRE